MLVVRATTLVWPSTVPVVLAREPVLIATKFVGFATTAVHPKALPVHPKTVPVHSETAIFCRTVAFFQAASGGAGQTRGVALVVVLRHFIVGQAAHQAGAEHKAQHVGRPSGGRPNGGVAIPFGMSDFTPALAARKAPLRPHHMPIFWPLAISALLVLFAFTQCSSPTKKQEKIAGVKVPTEWVEAIRASNPKRDTLRLLKQLEGFIVPDTLDGASENPHLNQGAFY